MEYTDKNGLTEAEFLAQYRPGDYVRPSVAADMVIFTVAETGRENYRRLPEKELRVLLIRRGGHPYLDCWALPGGFIRPDETAGQAAARELREETGVDGVYLEQLRTFTTPGRDPRTWVMSCAHMALVDSTKITLRPGDDADGAAWFKVCYRLTHEEREVLPDGVVSTRRYELTLTCGDTVLTCRTAHRRAVRESAWEEDFFQEEGGGLAFDHGTILACAMERLRDQVEHGRAALHLMPPLFTLTELQQVYEVILDKELLKAAFRRKITALVRETDRFTENAGHRPSRLYRRNLEELL